MLWRTLPLRIYQSMLVETIYITKNIKAEANSGRVPGGYERYKIIRMLSQNISLNRFETAIAFLLCRSCLSVFFPLVAHPPFCTTSLLSLQFLNYIDTSRKFSCF